MDEGVMNDPIRAFCGENVAESLCRSAGVTNFPADDIPDKVIINYENLFYEEDIDDFELCSSGDEELETRAPASPEGQTGSRVSNNRLDSQPIARRTRANISYNEYDLKDLEGLLDTEDGDELVFGKDLDDVEEYEKFLSSLRNQEGESNYNGLGMEADESEDEDFIQELKRMLEDQAEENYFGNFPPVKTGDPNVTSELPLKKLNMLFTRGPKTKKVSDLFKCRNVHRSFVSTCICV